MSVLNELRSKLFPKDDTRMDVASAEKELKMAAQKIAQAKQRIADYTVTVTLQVRCDRLADMAGDETFTPEKAEELIRNAAAEWVTESPFGSVVDVDGVNVHNASRAYARSAQSNSLLQPGSVTSAASNAFNNAIQAQVAAQLNAVNTLSHTGFHPPQGYIK